MWYIYCDENERRRRLKASRGYSDEKIDNILKSQLSEQTFRENADVVIDNSGALEYACAQVDQALRSYGVTKK
jgi:dephospho-CoA kinase